MNHSPVALSSAECRRAGPTLAAEITQERRLLLLDPADNVLVAVADLPAGLRIRDGDRTIALIDAVPMGNKFARVPIAAGSKVIKHGASIGSATRPIAAGALVHLHNLASDYLATPRGERAL